MPTDLPRRRVKDARPPRRLARNIIEFQVTFLAMWCLRVGYFLARFGYSIAEIVLLLAMIVVLVILVGLVR
jgi:hypothetical protein